MIRILVSLAAACLAAVAAHAGQKAAVFPFELNDISIEGQLAGQRIEETQRLALVSDALRELVARKAGYEVVDLSGFAAEIAKAAPLYKCDGCEADLARRAGADVAITGYVRKVSNLILKVFINVRDVDNGRLTRIEQVDIKGNTDETWLRGVRYIVINRLAAPQR